MSWTDWAAAETAAIRDAGQWRAPRSFDASGPAGALADGTEVVSFASNDYLGLTRHAAVVSAAHEAIDRWGTGSGSARLIVGSRPVHHVLEHDLAAWKRAEAAAVFPTGFATNLGVLTTFGGPGVHIFSDELNHASIIDGCRLARAEVSVYRHNDVGHLASLLSAAGDARCLVVSDLVFSMDGDVARIAALMGLGADHGALLVLDEAHAVLGPDLDRTLDGNPSVLRVGTLSKTLGALGGFVAGPRALVDLVVNRARSYIFTTAPTPADTAAARAAVRLIRSPEGEALVRRLRSVVDTVMPGHPSPIVPIVVGEEDAAVLLAAQLLERGLLVPAIRPPTVAPGSARLRVALSAAHTDAHLERLLGALEECLPGWRSCVPGQAPPVAAR